MSRHDTMSRPPPRDQPTDYKTTCQTYIPRHTTCHTYLYLLWNTVFFVLILTVVIPEAFLYLHREGRTLSSVGSIPYWGGGPFYIFSLVGQMSPLLFLYLTVMHCGAGLRMTSSCDLLQIIVLQIF